MSQWRRHRLKHVGSINARVLPETTDSDLPFTYFDIGDVGTGQLVNAGTEMTFGTAPSRARRLADEGDVLISTIRTYLRAVAPVPPASAEMTVFSTGFAVIHPNSHVDAGFLRYRLLSSDFIEEVVARSVGVSYPAISSGELGDIPVTLPDLTTQRAIAAFLDRETAQIDAMIEAQREVVRHLEDRRTATVLAAVTGSDSVGPRQDSWVRDLGTVPAHWLRGPLRRFTTFSTGFTPPTADDSNFEGGVPWANISDLRGRVISQTSRTISETASGIENQAIVESGSLLFGFKLSVGAVAFAGINMYTNEAIAAFRPSADLDLEYAYYALPILLTRNCNFNIYGAPLLNAQLIRAAPVAFPPVSEQRQIAAALSNQLANLDNLVDRSTAVISLLRERREALITAAVTGRIHPATAIERVNPTQQEAS